MAVKIGNGCFIAKTAVLIGDVELGDNVAIFDHAVLRGDLNKIVVGDNSNIQDNVTVHTEITHPAIIGSNVSIGHNAVVHGSTLGNYIIVGMGARTLNGAVIPEGCVIAAGTVVTENFTCDENSLIAGIPGKIKRAGDKNLREYAKKNAESYSVLRKKHNAGEFERITGSDLSQ